MFGELDLSEYRGANFQPSRASEGPVCPHYPIIEICALLTGISEEDLGKRKRFCGVYEQHYNTTSDLGGGVEGYRNRASTTCSSVYEKLTDMLNLVNEGVSLPQEKEIREKVAQAPSLTEAENILSKYNRVAERKTKRDAIIADWKRIVFKTSFAPINQGGNNHHFREIEKAEDLSEETVIRYVAAFREGLEKVVGKKEAGAFELMRSRAAKGCDQSPVSGDFPFHFSD